MFSFCALFIFGATRMQECINTTQHQHQKRKPVPVVCDVGLRFVVMKRLHDVSKRIATHHSHNLIFLHYFAETCRVTTRQRTRTHIDYPPRAIEWHRPPRRRRGTARQVRARNSKKGRMAKGGSMAKPAARREDAPMQVLVQFPCHLPSYCPLGVCYPRW